MTQLLFDRLSSDGGESMSDAVSGSDLGLVKWLHEHQAEVTIDAMDIVAARTGNLDICQWLHVNRTEGCTTSAMDDSASNGHLKMVQWLHANRSEGCTTKAMDGAILR